MTEDDKAKRIINTLTGPWEKRNLPRMARALPEWINSDHLTVLGIIAGFIIGAGYLLSDSSRWWLLLSNAGLLIHWYADSLDGTLARVRKKERERYGYFVDHISDAWTTFIICGSLGISDLMSMDIALYLAIGYLLLNVYAHIIAYTQRSFPLSYGYFGPTEVRIMIGIFNFVLIFWNPVLTSFGGEQRTFLDLASLLVATIFIIIFVYVSITDAIKLDRLDRKK